VEKDERHWITETYKQRMTTKEWQKILLDYDDSVIFQGKLRKLKARKLGAGVVEIFKEPLQKQI
jgi:hypothetical protein